MLILVFELLEYNQRCFDAIFWHEQLNTSNSALHAHAYTHDHCRYSGALQGNPCQIRVEPHRVASDDFHRDCPQCRVKWLPGQHRRFDASEYLRDEADIAAYLKAAASEEDPRLLAAALGDVARAQECGQ